MNGGDLLWFVVFVLAVSVIALTACFFIACRKYEEGLVGNLFLGLLVIACVAVLVDATMGRLELPAPLFRLIIICAAGFMARHGYRFAMFHWHGWFGWKPPADMEARAAEH